MLAGFGTVVTVYGTELPGNETTEGGFLVFLIFLCIREGPLVRVSLETGTMSL